MSLASHGRHRLGAPREVRVSPAVPGWTAIVVIVAIFASVQLLMIGILGEYVGRIYEEVKRRPLYVVGDTVNLPGHREAGEDEELEIMAGEEREEAPHH